MYDFALMLICIAIFLETFWDKLFGTTPKPLKIHDKINVIKITCNGPISQHDLNTIVHQKFRPETVYCDGYGTYYLFYHQTKPTVEQNLLRTNEFQECLSWFCKPHVHSIDILGFVKKKSAIGWLQSQKQLVSCGPSVSPKKSYAIKIFGTQIEKFIDIPLTNKSAVKRFIFDRPTKKIWQRAHKQLQDCNAPRLAPISKNIEKNDDEIVVNKI